MAASRTEEALASEQQHHDSYHRPQIPDAIQVPESQYQEIGSTQPVPTKSGEAEAIKETQQDDERPRTSGTTHSGITNFSETEEGSFLAANTHKFTDGTLQDAGSPYAEIPMPFAVRDMTEDPVADAKSAFSFGKPAQHRLNMTGIRKGYSASTNSRTDSMEDNQMQRLQQPSTEISGYAATPRHTKQEKQAQAAVDANRKKSHSKKKKQKDQRCSTAPAEEIAGSAPDRKDSQRNAAAVDARGPIASQDNASPHTAIGTSLEVMPNPHRVDRGKKIDLGEDYNHVAKDLEDQAQAPASDESFHKAGSEAEVGFTDLQLHDYSQAALQQHYVRNQSARRSDEQEVQILEPQKAPCALPEKADQLLESINQDVRPQDGRQSFAEDQVVLADSHHRVSTGQGLRKDTKRKRKARGPAPAAADILHSDHSGSDVDDYLKIYAYKCQQSRRAASRKWAAEREAMQIHLQNTLDAKQALQEELESIHQQKMVLAAAAQQQQDKVHAYEAKVNRFKTFVDGLGNDVNSLKKEASATRRKGEQLNSEVELCRAEHSALFEQLSACAQKSAQLKDQALGACQEAQSDVQAAHLRNDYLEQQLSERIGLLAEERDRRAQLERQLANAASSDEAILRAIKTSNNIVLDKLFEIHAVVDDFERGKKAAELLEKTIADIQALASQQTTNANGIASVKSTVESLLENITTFIGSTSVSSSEERSDAGFESRVHETLQGLRAELDERERLMEQAAQHQSELRSLRERLTACDSRLVEESGLRASLETEKAYLSEKLSALQEQTRTLQRHSSPSEATQMQLSGMQAELDAKAKALDAVQADMSSRNEEFCNLHATNKGLQDQIQTIQSQLQHAESRVVEYDAEKAEIERRHESSLEKQRCELSQHAQNAYMRTKMDADNNLRSVTSQRDDLQKQVKPLKEEVGALRSKLKELQKNSQEVVEKRDRQLHDLEKQVHAYQQDLEVSRASVSDLRSQLEADDASKEQASLWASQFDTEKTEHQKTSSQRDALMKQLKELQHTLERVQSSHKETNTQLQKLCTEKDTELENVTKQLMQARELAQKADMGNEKLKQQANDDLAKEQEKNERSMLALQSALEEARKEAEDAKNRREDNEVTIQRAWADDQKKREAHKAAARTQTANAEALRDEAVTEVERLRSELGKLKQNQQQLWSSDPRNMLQHPVPDVPGGITPTTSNKENQPPKPRKKVDRTTNAVIEDGLLPVPEVLRRPGARTSESQLDENRQRGPVVEDSLAQGPAPYIVQTLRSAMSTGQAKPAVIRTHSDNEDMLDTASMQSRFPSAVVEETQILESLPSFAEFNENFVSSKGPASQAASPIFSIPSLREEDDLRQPTQESMASVAVGNASNTTVAAPMSTEFAIYEDSESIRGHAGLHDAEVQHVHDVLQDNLTWTQAERDKYTFRRERPHPNSASKMVHRDNESKWSTRMRYDNPLSSLPPRSQAVQTPQDHGNVKCTAANDMRTLSAQTSSPLSSPPATSSPDFIDDPGDIRRTTYYAPSASGSARRRDSRKASLPPADPRLAGREDPRVAKRKAGKNIAEGYEHERKRRLNKAERVVPVDHGRYILRTHSQSSVHDLPNMASINSRTGTGTSGSSQSRLRTLGGTSARGKRGSKMSKNEEINARFSQELRR